MQVDGVILDPAQGNSHVAKGQGRQCTTGPGLHAFKVGLADLVGQIVESGRFRVNLACAACEFVILKGLADHVEKIDDLLVVVRVVVAVAVGAERDPERGDATGVTRPFPAAAQVPPSGLNPTPSRRLLRR